MSLVIKIAEEEDRAVWNDIVDNSLNSTIFHKWEWLKITEKYSNNIFLPFLIFNGTYPVAIYPVFLVKKGLFYAALSPPTGSYLLYLGPVISGYEELKQHKKESLLIAIQEGIDNILFKEYNVRYVRILPGPGIFDSRPYKWSGYDVEPLYTYRINLKKGIDEIWSGFQRKLRLEIKKAEREGVTVHEGDEKDIEYILNSLSQRFIDQGYDPSDHSDYVKAIYNNFKDTNIKIFIARYNDENVGGMISPYYNGILYLWIGIPKNTTLGISVNDLVQWEAIKWAKENNFAYYEEMDSGREKRLRFFKSKYNPDLHIWYSATKFSSPVYKLGRLLKKSL